MTRKRKIPLFYTHVSDYATEREYLIELEIEKWERQKRLNRRAESSTQNVTNRQRFIRDAYHNGN